MGVPEGGGELLAGDQPAFEMDTSLPGGGGGTLSPKRDHMMDIDGVLGLGGGKSCWLMNSQMQEETFRSVGGGRALGLERGSARRASSDRTSFLVGPHSDSVITVPPI